MTEISSVPANSGTAPNAPDEPTWSARIAVCGLHCSAEQEVEYGEMLGEEAERFERHRGDDADGGEHRDGRAADAAATR